METGWQNGVHCSINFDKQKNQANLLINLCVSQSFKKLASYNWNRWRKVFYLLVHLVHRFAVSSYYRYIVIGNIIHYASSIVLYPSSDQEKASCVKGRNDTNLFHCKLVRKREEMEEKRRGTLHGYTYQVYPFNFRIAVCRDGFLFNSLAHLSVRLRTAFTSFFLVFFIRVFRRMDKWLVVGLLHSK